MKLQTGYGAIHHLIDATGHLHCGQSEASLDSLKRAPRGAVTCPACLRILADEVRHSGPRTHDSED